MAVRLAFLTQKPATEGADTATLLSQPPDAELETGLFWADRKLRDCEFCDEAAERELWNRCESLLAGPSQTSSTG